MTREMDTPVRLLQALGDPARLSIVRQLADEGCVCVCDLTVCCELAQPTVSHHLRVLREAGIVESERRGTWAYYTLRPGALDRLDRVVQALRPAHAAGGTPPRLVDQGSGANVS